MKTYADLQIHTKYSDGAYDPVYLIKKTKTLGIKAVSFTDHHYLFSPKVINKINFQSKKSELKFIEGTEISCTFEKIDFHLLAYSKKFKRSPGFKKVLHSLHKAYNVRGFNILKKLTREGYPIKKADFNGLFYTYLHKNLISSVWTKKFNLSTETFKAISLPQVSFMAPFEKVINIVNSSNGLAILAHPGSFYKKMSPKNFEQFLVKLIKLGLGGIELYHYRNSDKQMFRIIKKLTKKHNLVITGGSDYHSDIASGAKLGRYGLNKKEFNNFYKRLL